MELIVDANALFSFFKFKSAVRRLIIKSTVYGLKIYAPDFCINELENNKERILEISKLDDSNFALSLFALDSFIFTIPKSGYVEFLEKAEKLLPLHTKDAAYLALALKLNCPLWSEEKRLKKQSKVKVYSTSELMREVGLKK